MPSRSARTLILFDVTRLVSAVGRPIPTGVERVENAYATWLSGDPAFDVVHVVTTPRGLRVVPQARMDRLLARQDALWSRGDHDGAAGEIAARINRWLRSEGTAGTSAVAAPARGRENAFQPPVLSRLVPRRGRPLRLAPPPQARLSRLAQVRPLVPLDTWLAQRANPAPTVYLRTSPDRMEAQHRFAALARHGVPTLAFCHDALPLALPELFRPGATALYAARMATMVEIADALVVATQSVADDLAAHLGPLPMPVRVAALGADVALAVEPPEIADAPFFLIASTIEGRKNHHLLLQIWRRFIDTMGAAAPRLVIAGKRGWMAEAPLAMLDRAEDLRPFVLEAGAVPEAVLAALRRRARAVLVPSFAEGFGLPVVEALAAGTPVIASDIAPFREVAGDVATLVDPLDGPGWRRAILAHADDGSTVWQDAKARAAAYTPPRWQEHFAAVAALIDDTLAERCR